MIVAINRQIDGGANGGVNEGVNEGVSEGVRKEIIELVAILMINEGLKVHNLVAKRGKSRATIERYLKLAKELSIIEFRGSPKTGGYYITQSMRKRIKDPGE